MPNTYRIQVLTKDFVKELGIEYSDAQYFDIPVDMTIEEFQKQNEDTINSEKEKRISSFIESIKNPPTPVEPTKDELIAFKQAVQDEYAAKLEELDAQIAEKK